MPVRRRALGALLLLWHSAPPARAAAQGTAQAARHTAAPASAAPLLVLDHVTVIDVAHGTRLADQRVVIEGTRIRAVGTAGRGPLPRGARVVDARGQYLIPGLWDLHVHTRHAFLGPLLLANGVTGIRDAGSPVPLDTLRRWRREILAGTRVGPPRQLLSGQSIAGPQADCDRRAPKYKDEEQTCVRDSADAVHYVDSLTAAGADMIKPRAVSRALYFAIAAEARRRRIPFGGHAENVTAVEAADSGARIVDHLTEQGAGIDQFCTIALPNAGFLGMLRDAFIPHRLAATGVPSLARCRALADRFRRQGTWWVPTRVANQLGFQGPVPLGTPGEQGIVERFRHLAARFVDDTAFDPAAVTGTATYPGIAVDTGPTSLLHMLRAVDFPILAGTDASRLVLPGFALHAELASLVVDGLTPLQALQSATLNPAQMLHATDSLGTVAPGTLADLVLLDGDPLADIGNTTRIRAVVANGRYFDRAALDALLRQAQREIRAARAQTSKP